MRPTSDSQGELVLYHAVSSYQLLEVLLHRLEFHPRDRAVLLLPDFIAEKYPRYRRLADRGFFQEVYLFPYLRIPHRSEGEVCRETARRYREVVPHPIGDFSRVYVAGAHFYFSLYLIENQVPFTFFEDAAGMLSRGEELYRNLSVRYPLHGEIARKHGLFDGSCPWVREIVCLEGAQRKPLPPHCRSFSVEQALEGLSPRRRREVVGLFLNHPLCSRAQAILLTQHLANLGATTWEGQIALYKRLAQGPLRGLRLLVKPHPDDALDYREIFPGARVLRQVFPAELLPYVFLWGPRVVYTLDSTSCENLKRHFIIIKLGRESHGL